MCTWFPFCQSLNSRKLLLTLEGFSKGTNNVSQGLANLLSGPCMPGVVSSLENVNGSAHVAEQWARGLGKPPGGRSTWRDKLQKGGEELDSSGKLHIRVLNLELVPALWTDYIRLLRWDIRSGLFYNLITSLEIRIMTHTSVWEKRLSFTKSLNFSRKKWHLYFSLTLGKLYQTSNYKCRQQIIIAWPVLVTLSPWESRCLSSHTTIVADAWKEHLTFSLLERQSV